MFRHLRIKLTVLYAGLFCVVLALIGAVVYAVVDDNTQRLARSQLDSAGAMFAQLQDARLQQLEDGARFFANDSALQNAVAAGDATLLHESLLRVREEIRSDLVFVVTREGLLIGESGAGVSSVPPGLQLALSRDATPAGLIRQGGALFQAAAAQLNSRGWIVVGRRVGADDIVALQQTSAFPLQAAVLTRGRDGRWASDAPGIDQFIDHSLAGDHRRAD